MPAQGGPSNGPKTGVAQLPIVTRTVVLANGGPTFSVEILSDNLPGITVYCLQSVGFGLVTVTPQFAVGNLANVVNWQALAPTFVLAPGVPSVPTFKLGSRRHRLSFTSVGVNTVIYRITNSLV